MLVERVLPKARECLATIGHDAPVTMAADLMSKPDVNLLAVCDAEGRMVGVLTKTDIVGQIRTCTGCSCTARVEGIMTTDVFSCRPGEWLHNVWSAMKQKGLQRIPVTDRQGRPIGILSARDALQALMTEVENEESLLRDYVMCVGFH